MDLKQYKNELEKQTKDVTDVEEFVKIAKQLVDELDYKEFDEVGLDMDALAGMSGELSNDIENYIINDWSFFEDEKQKSFDYVDKLFENWKKSKINELENNNELEKSDALSSLNFNSFSANSDNTFLACADEIFISYDGYYSLAWQTESVLVGNPNVINDIALEVIELVNGEKGAIIDEIDFVVYEQEQTDDVNDDNRQNLITEIVDKIEDMMDLSSIEEEVIYDLCLKKYIYFEEDDCIADLLYDILDEEFDNNFK